MKVLYILPENIFLNTEHFRARFIGMPDEYEIHVLVVGDADQDGVQFSGTTLHVIPLITPWSRKGMVLSTLALLKRGMKIARNNKVDIVICYDPLVHGILGVCIKLLCRVKLLIEINGHLRDAQAAMVSSNPPGFLKRHLFNLVGTISLFWADCVKILNAHQYHEWIGVLRRKPVVMFPNFIPIQQFQPSYSQNDSFLLCLGHPYYGKGVDVLLEAFAKIRDEYPDLILKVVGHCREPELSQWKERANLVGNVQILRGVPYEDVGDLLAGCVALVVPSRSEGMGRVFIEAMACGKPCIGTKVGGIPNIIDDGVTGFLVEPENSWELSQRIQQLVGDPELCQAMGKKGRLSAETRLSEASYVRNFTKTLDLIFRDEDPGKGIVYNGFE